MIRRESKRRSGRKLERGSELIALCLIPACSTWKNLTLTTALRGPIHYGLSWGMPAQLWSSQWRKRAEYSVELRGLHFIEFRSNRSSRFGSPVALNFGFKF